MSAKPRERFWRFVDLPDDQVVNCWLWRGGSSREGYGHFWLNGRTVGAHVFSFEIHQGISSDGMWVLHTCDTPSCVNPNHLYLGTPKDNSRDRDTRGRANTAGGDRNWTRLYPDQVRRGEDKNQAKLTWTRVRDIRRRAAGGESQRGLARDFGVDPSCVSRIVAGKSWPLRNGEQPW